MIIHTYKCLFIRKRTDKSDLPTMESYILIAIVFLIGSGKCADDVLCTSTGPACISDCKGVANGDYQSCTGCHVYMTCSEGLPYDQRICPADLVWDDKIKRCEYHSETCTGCVSLPCVSTGENCVDGCTGVPDGDYQDCKSCHGYMSCSGGHAHRDRPCATDQLVWNDEKKQCDYTSPTCTPCPDEKP